MDGHATDHEPLNRAGLPYRSCAPQAAYVERDGRLELGGHLGSDDGRQRLYGARNEPSPAFGGAVPSALTASAGETPQASRTAMLAASRSTESVGGGLAPSRYGCQS